MTSVKITSFEKKWGESRMLLKIKRMRSAKNGFC